MSRANQFNESRAHQRRAGRAGGFGGGPRGTRLPDVGCRMAVQTSFVYESNGEPIIGKVAYLSWNREGDYHGRADEDFVERDDYILSRDPHLYGGRGSVLVYRSLEERRLDDDGTILESIDNTVFDSMAMARGKPNQWLRPEPLYRAQFGGRPSQHTFVSPCFYSGANGFGDLSIAFEENGEGRIERYRSLAYLTAHFGLVGNNDPYQIQTPFIDKRGNLFGIVAFDGDVGTEYKDQRTGAWLSDYDVIARYGMNSSFGIRRRRNGEMEFEDFSIGNSGGTRFTDALNGRLSRYDAKIPVPLGVGDIDVIQSWGGGIYTRWEAWMFVEDGKTFHPIGVIGYVYDQYGDRFSSAPERWWAVCMGISDVYSTVENVHQCRVSVAGK